MLNNFDSCFNDDNDSAALNSWFVREKRQSTANRGILKTTDSTCPSKTGNVTRTKAVLEFASISAHAEHYYGNPGGCRAFCLSVLSFWSCRFHAAISHWLLWSCFVMNLLQGRTLNWATSLRERRAWNNVSYLPLSKDMKRVFYHIVFGSGKANVLLALGRDIIRFLGLSWHLETSHLSCCRRESGKRDNIFVRTELFEFACKDEPSIYFYPLTLACSVSTLWITMI